MDTRDRYGFSLIELMVVVVIIGILVAIAIPNYISMQNRAKEASVKGNAHAVQLAVEEHAVENDGAFPVAPANIVASMFPGGVFPNNPFTGAPITITASVYVQGCVGYRHVGGVYDIDGYGYSATSGPWGDGTVIRLSNG